MNFSDYCFHDSIIKDVRQDGEQLILRLAESQYEGALGDCNVVLSGGDLGIYYIHQRPRKKMPHFKGREITVAELTRLFKKGFTVLIEDLWKNTETNNYVLYGVLFPFSRGAGVCRRIYISFDNEPKIISK